MVASITGVQSPLISSLICYRRPQISELRHIFKTSITYLDITYTNLQKKNNKEPEGRKQRY
jgi:hypothetical protein